MAGCTKYKTETSSEKSNSNANSAETHRPYWNTLKRWEHSMETVLPLFFPGHAVHPEERGSMLSKCLQHLESVCILAVSEIF